MGDYVPVVVAVLVSIDTVWTRPTISTKPRTLRLTLNPGLSLSLLSARCGRSIRLMLRLQKEESSRLAFTPLSARLQTQETLKQHADQGLAKDPKAVYKEAV
ncbi:hypothetical protein PHYSODRAFT_295684 [Phytophthora sojae]|uniref:Uncharacterized protein n=1 Tax=Phytophthora sojae (strain P6497) TaxID=1094619 RepID=G4YVR5_PHYSP|nr:hypothetical protein PHYSODRAFT_295684 [Phytophthora sojae]EGZ23163.1 hypothetical protein PHYSODRAFT_295684 [Phytophthora sojae]|eukprot:XP_009518451.1 hypothetical protein PHYSODRAFT_295684 [Phytophthora sojae]